MVLDKFTNRAKNILSKVSKTVEFTKNKDKIFATTLFQAIVDESGFGSLLASDWEPGVYAALKVNISKINFYEVIEQSALEAFEMKHQYVGTEHLLLALLKSIGSKDYSKVQKKVLTTGTYPQISKKTVKSPKRTPLLDAFGTNLSAIFESGNSQKLIDRVEVENLEAILLQKAKANALIVGETGVGKSSLVRLLVNKICNFETSALISNIQIIEFDFDAFLSSVISREGVEAGFTALHDELMTVPDALLYIPSIHGLFAPQGTLFAPTLISNLFKNLLLFSGVQIVASTTSSHFQKYLSEDEDVLSNFTPLKLKEPDKTIIEEILDLKAKELEKFHAVKIPAELTATAYNLCEKYVRDKKFPLKGIDLMDKACSILSKEKTKIPLKLSELKKQKMALHASLAKFISVRNLEAASKIQKRLVKIDQKFGDYKVSKGIPVLTEEYLYRVVSKETGIPLGKLSDKEAFVYANIKGLLAKRLIGQEEAIDTLASALLRGRLGLSNKKRPIGSFLFLGPTGVGKTELAKIVSEELFGADSLIKLDMSDFSEKHTVSRLVGAPPGYVGFAEGGELTEKISKSPFSVVLFDEIEKAHSDVLNILLQILDDGALVDARGKAFDFTNSVVILTSNLGSELIKKNAMGFVLKNEPEKKDISDPIKERLLDNLKKILKPELLNRFDEIIVFNKLDKVHVASILDIYLKEFIKHLKETNMHLSVNKTVKDLLIKEGFSDEYGARSLRRTFNKLLVDAIAKALVESGVSSNYKLKVSLKKKTKALDVTVLL
ncbi:MAG: AAA family ATPase [Patescibacteria group bacterium]